MVTLPGQGVKDKGFPADPDLEPENEPGSSSYDPPAVPGLPVTEGEFPIIHETPAPSDQVPIPENGSDSDSDATVDYRDQQSSLLSLVEGEEDILIELPSDFRVPDFVPLDGDKFASWLTRQDKVKAGAVTPEMQRRYAKAPNSTSSKVTWITVLCVWRTNASCPRTLISLLVVGF